MRVRLPTAVAVAAGLITLADFFVEHPQLDRAGTALVSWVAILSAFALVLGLLNVAAVHANRVRERRRGWPNSIVLLLSASAVLVPGLIPGAGGPQAPAVRWIFENVQAPLQTAFLSLLVFFMATAAYRTFRARDLPSVLLLGTAVVVLLGQAPAIGAFSDQLPAVKNWILAVPSAAGARGILIGAGLGIITTGLRVLLGLDRPYSN